MIWVYYHWMRHEHAIVVRMLVSCYNHKVKPIWTSCNLFWPCYKLTSKQHQFGLKCCDIFSTYHNDCWMELCFLITLLCFLFAFFLLPGVQWDKLPRDRKDKHFQRHFWQLDIFGDNFLNGGNSGNHSAVPRNICLHSASEHGAMVT